MDVSIRAAVREDAATLQALLDAQLSEHDIELAPAHLAAAIDGIFSGRGDGAFLVAVDADVPVGVAYLSFTWALEHGGRSAWLEELYVLPEHRGAGIGERLLHAAIEHARAAGAAAIDLEVDADHQRAEGLYARNGFMPHRRARWYRRLIAR